MQQSEAHAIEQQEMMCCELNKIHDESEDITGSDMMLANKQCNQQKHKSLNASVAT